MKTLVIGASENPERYSNKAIRLLKNYKHEVLAVGLRNGMVDNTKIETGLPDFEEVDTVTLYVGPERQKDIIPYVVRLNPRRVIFNPGTENPEFYEKLNQNNISFEEACTLVLLNTGQF